MQNENDPGGCCNEEAATSEAEETCSSSQVDPADLADPNAAELAEAGTSDCSGPDPATDECCGGTQEAAPAVPKT